MSVPRGPACAHDLGLTALEELVRFACGEFLGAGISRRVYVYRPDPRWVVKINHFESPERVCHQNVLEWETWRDSQFHEPTARWLAPCGHMSPLGGVMLQRRTTPIPTRRLPKQVPIWATDLKAENWGLYRGRPVMHDYGLTRMHALGSINRLKKAEW